MVNEDGREGWGVPSCSLSFIVNGWIGGFGGWVVLVGLIL
jgi:tetrahydromethanopterin S-methyltransferase subunit D